MSRSNARLVAMRDGPFVFPEMEGRPSQADQRLGGYPVIPQASRDLSRDLEIVLSFRVASGLAGGYGDGVNRYFLKQLLVEPFATLGQPWSAAWMDAHPVLSSARALTILALLNVVLGLFNLVPLPPLDGASVLEGAAPRATAGMYQRLREIPAFDFLGLMIAWRFFPYVSDPALRFASHLLHS